MTRSRTALGITLLLVLAASPALAQRVYVDYDRDVDFDAYRSFAWVGTPETSMQGESPLVHSRLKNSIEHYLAQAGLAEDTEAPDLYVTYHTSSKEKVSYSTSTMGAGYGPGWGFDPYWGGGMSTTTAHAYEEGTLIIDLWDAESKNMVWRGSATAVVKSKPEKLAKQIDKAVAKMIAAFDKKYQKGM